MLQSFFAEATLGMRREREGDKTLGFLRLVADFHGLKSVSYLVLNLPSQVGAAVFTHALATGDQCRFRLSEQRADVSALQQLDLFRRPYTAWNEVERLRIESFLRHDADVASGLHGFSFPVRPVDGESGLIAFLATPSIVVPGDDGRSPLETIILAGEYHHLCEMAHASGTTAVMSDRERECLLCIAGGMTALEAAETLGIVERTVRFHLNAAREKLGCSNTTHAVAKATLLRLM